MEKILIVDDEKDNLDALRRLLRQDFDIQSTTSAFDALKMLQNDKFAVIVSDQRMPEMSGVDLLEKARNICPHTTRILLTGYTDIDAVIESINRGNVYRYVAKPWEPNDLKITLKQSAEAYRLKLEIEQKNTALEKANSELKAAFASLQTLDRAKARFLSLISHELNTPLTVLNSFIELLESQQNEFPEDLRTAVDSLGLASDRLTEIVGDVLLYVKIEANPDPQRQRVNIKDLIESIRPNLNEALERKKLKLDIQAPQEQDCDADPDKLGSALKSLLLDTIARTPNGESIRVKLGAAEGKFEITILSAGEPISEAALEPLETGGSELRHGQRLGLALAICRLVVQAHGGEISVKPTPGVGNLVRILL